jgi:hypothetical protein
MKQLLSLKMLPRGMRLSLVMHQAVSKMSGVGEVKEGSGIIEATLIGFDRKIKADPVITTLAILIKESLDL